MLRTLRKLHVARLMRKREAAHTGGNGVGFCVGASSGIR